MTQILCVTQFDAVTNRNINAWLKEGYDEQTKLTIKKLLKEHPEEIADAFSTNLSFGTGGLRGLIGIGTNRINQYTIRACTQGLANYLNKQPTHAAQLSVLIGYDCRHYSREFAEECAKVLAGNNIQVYIYQDIRPTPLVSFGCRYKKCDAAIMLTASHNPAQYNGYKLYGKDGAQVSPPHDQLIVKEINEITALKMIKYEKELNHPLIKWIKDEIDQAYLKAIMPLQLYPEENKKEGSTLKIVYTSLHGTGITVVPTAMKSWGFSTIKLVTKQVTVDGNFPTVKSPNPEEEEALKLGKNTLKHVKGEILIATDPDADRVGIVINHHGHMYSVDGNQLACLLLDHILEALSKQKGLPKNAAFVKTIVTSELFQKICESYGKPCFNVLSGFKYIAEKIHEWESSLPCYQYLFGVEESCGYLYGTLARDKDAVLTSLLICEMALHTKLQGKTLIDKLHELWQKYGTYVEKTFVLKFKDTNAGKGQILRGISALQKNPPQTIGGIEVIRMEDYLTSKRMDLKTGKSEEIFLNKSEFLVFYLADESKLAIRPSGTEPKLKVYCGVRKKNFINVEEAAAEGKKHAQFLLTAFQCQLYKSYLGSISND
nr:phospho-sugar mutase [Neochlamydia sp. AcF84]